MGHAEVAFSFKTRRNENPSGKPRVYFTCHPQDLGPYLDVICGYVFKTHDCAVYYTADMTADMSNENTMVDLERMNLFVLPVTKRLLTEPNRAMDSDFPFAMERHIPVLPVMMEPGLDALYSRGDRFGELQYVSPFREDPTEVSFADKLKRFLESVLISDELAQRVRKAFDAYIFLSYRKKDRAYANALMQLIHANPETYGISIWFDEFLIPGESFRESISRILQDSELFAMVVTPNLLEKVDGKPNFVMGEEYPAAKRAGKAILPVEMLRTDRQSLSGLFDGIPECVDAHNDSELRRRLLDSLVRVSSTVSDDDSEHCFLIGIAYLEGIDMEVDTERGVELITRSGNCGYPEAILRLRDMYQHGLNVKQDYWMCLAWADRLYDVLLATKGESHPETVDALFQLASSYYRISDLRESLALYEEVYGLQREVLGESHPDVFVTLIKLARLYARIGRPHEALGAYEKIVDLCGVEAGKEELRIDTLHAMAKLWGALGNYHKRRELLEEARELGGAVHVARDEPAEDKPSDRQTPQQARDQEKLVDLQRRMQQSEASYMRSRRQSGERSPRTVDAKARYASACHKLGVAYKKQRCFAEALKTLERAYDLRRVALGEEAPQTISTVKELAATWHALGDAQKALEWYQVAYESCLATYGELGRRSLATLKRMVACCQELGSAEGAVLGERMFDVMQRIYEAESTEHSIKMKRKLAGTYLRLGDVRKASEQYEKIRAMLLDLYGEEDPRSLSVLNSQANQFAGHGQIQLAKELWESAYARHMNVLGEDHPQTLQSLRGLASAYAFLGDYREALVLYERLYALQVSTLGDQDKFTLSTAQTIGELREKQGSS